MKTKAIVITLILAALLGAGFYFKDNLADFYLRLTGKISEFEKTSLDLAKEIQKQISAPPPLQKEGEAPLGNLTKAGVIQLTNVQRQNNGLAVLRENSKLDSAALKKAQDMLTKQYFEHISPSGVGPAELAKSVGYDYLAIGENLAMGNFKDDQDLIDAWMASPGHRANILNSRYREIGVAVIKGVYQGNTVWMAVQEFGLPLSACPSPDASLKLTIDSNLKQIDSLAAAIAAKKTEIDNAKNRSQYNQAVNEYNSLVQQYNNLASITKKLISSYNSQVEQFNQCVAQ